MLVFTVLTLSPASAQRCSFYFFMQERIKAAAAADLHVCLFFARLSVCASAPPRRIPPLALALTVCDAVAACFSLVFPLAKRNVGCFVVFLAARHLAVAASGGRAPVFYTVSPIKNNTNNDNAEASSSRSVREAFLILKKHICVNVQILTQQKTNVNRRNRVQNFFFFIKCWKTLD